MSAFASSLLHHDPSAVGSRIDGIDFDWIITRKNREALHEPYVARIIGEYGETGVVSGMGKGAFC
jgi:hypothetical protein